MIGKVLFEYDSLTSTNEWALELANHNDIAEGAVIQAHHQSHGRGQMGTRWHSDAGKNLMLSIILKPLFLALKDQFYLNKAVSLAVVDTLEYFLRQPIWIKWPNDILVDHEKIAGILIQNTIQAKEMVLVIVGIGINVNQVRFSSTLPNPTSICKKMGAEQDLISVRTQLFDSLNVHYRSLMKDIRYGDTSYRQRLYRRGQRTSFRNKDGSSWYGTIVDVTDHGKLLVKSDLEEIRMFSLKEISYQ